MLQVIKYCSGICWVLVHVHNSESRFSCSDVTQFPNPGSRVPPTVYIFIVALSKHSSFNSLRAWWLVDRLNQVCLSRVTINMCTVGGTQGSGLGNTDIISMCIISSSSCPVLCEYLSLSAAKSKWFQWRPFGKLLFIFSKEAVFYQLWHWH